MLRPSITCATAKYRPLMWARDAHRMSVRLRRRGLCTSSKTSPAARNAAVIRS